MLEKALAVILKYKKNSSKIVFEYIDNDLRNYSDFKNIQLKMEYSKIQFPFFEKATFNKSSYQFTAKLDNIKYNVLIKNINSNKYLLHFSQNLESHNTIENSYKTIFNSFNEGVLIFDITTGNIANANAKACSFYGYTYDEIVNLHIEELSSGKDSYTWEKGKEILRTLNQKKEIQLEWLAKNKSGDFFWIDVYSTKIKYENEDKILAIIKDLSHQKKIENEMHLASERFRNIFDFSSEALLIYTLDGSLAQMNKRAIELFGVNDDQYNIIESNALASHENDFVNAIEKWELAKKGEKVIFDWVASNYLTGEQIYLEISLNKICIDNEDYLLASMRDITHRKTSEQQLKKYTERLKLQHTIDKAILKADNEDNILNSAISYLKEYKKCNRVTVIFFDQSELTLSIKAAVYDEDTLLKYGEVRPLNDFRLTKEFYDGKPLIVNNIKDIESPTKIEKELIEAGLNSYISVPMIIGSELIGSLNMTDKKSDFFFQDDIETAMEIADSITVAIMQLDLIEIVKQQSDRLTKIREIEHSIINQTSSGAIAQIAVNNTRDLMNASRASVTIFDYENDYVFIQAVDRKNTSLPVKANKIPFADYTISEELKNGNPFYVKDILLMDNRRQIDIDLLREGIRSHIGFPLVANDKLIGSLNFGSEMPNAFNDEHIEIGLDIAYPLAIALSQADLRDSIINYNLNLENIVEERTNELMAANAELSEKQELLQEIADSVPGAVFQATLHNDSQFSANFISQGFYELFNIPIDSFKNHAFAALNICKDDIELFKRSLKLSNSIAKQWITEFRHIMPDNTIKWVRLSANPLFNIIDSSITYTGTMTDITNQKRSEEIVLKLNTDLKKNIILLQAANKELEAFSYSVSHDLRAPLRSMDGFSQVLIEEYSEMLDENGKNYLQRIRSASQKMGQLIEDLLKLSRLTRLEVKYEEFDLAEISQQIFDELALQCADREIDFTAKDSIIVNADLSLIKILLTNLISNSIKFTSKHETASIEIGEEIIDGEKFYYVKDDGAGFNMEYAGKIFGAFQRLHSPTQFEGSGVGLAIAQRIINKHGGKIFAISEIEKGAVFYFSLI